MIIRALKTEEWIDAMALAWKTFLKFEADDYGPEGVKSFYQFVTNPELETMFKMGQYHAFGAFDNDKIVGIIGYRSDVLLSLLFVDAEYHHKGIATELVGYLIDYMQETLKKKYVLVNSSPYAVGFYHHLGFVDTGKEVCNNGIKYTPMRMDF